MGQRADLFLSSYLSMIKHFAWIPGRSSAEAHLLIIWLNQPIYGLISRGRSGISIPQTPMPKPGSQFPIYTPANCKAAYQLNWSLNIFWREEQASADWLEALKGETEKDGVRILGHVFKPASISQFLASTRPGVAPAEIARSVKARLQQIVREARPHAFRRNYSIRSVGPAQRKAIESYVERQLERAPIADPRVRESLARLQIEPQGIDLSAPLRLSHAVAWCNLHLVFVNAGRWRELDPKRLGGLARDDSQSRRQARRPNFARGDPARSHPFGPGGSSLKRAAGNRAFVYEQLGVRLRHEAGFPVRLLRGNIRGVRPRSDSETERLRSGRINRRPTGASPVAAKREVFVFILVANPSRRRVEPGGVEEAVLANSGSDARVRGSRHTKPPRTQNRAKDSACADSRRTDQQE